MPIDYGPLYEPFAGNGVTRGNKYLGGALDAVLERRNRLQQEQMQQDAANTRARASAVESAAYHEQLGVQHKADLDQRITAQHAVDEDRDRQRTQREEEFGPKLLQAAQAAAAIPGGAGAAQRLLQQYQDWEQHRSASAQPAQPASAQPAAANPAAASPNPEGPGALPPNPTDMTSWLQGPQGAQGHTSVEPQDVQPPPTAAPPPAAAPARPAPVMNLPQAVARPAGPPLDLSGMNPDAKAQKWLARQMANPNHPPEVKARLAGIADSVREGLRDPKTADDAVQDVYREIAANKRSALDRANRPDQGLKDENTRGLIEGRWLENVQSFIKTQGYGRTIEDSNAFDELSLMANGATVEPAFATLIRGRWAKFGQGAGVLTEHDLQTFYGDLGGIATKFGTSLEQILSGKVTPEVAGFIEKAVDKLKQRTETRQGLIGAALVKYMERTPGGSERVERFLSSMFPTYYEKWAAGKKGPAGPVDAKASEAKADKWLRELGAK
jgi:hypothetical protein